MNEDHLLTALLRDERRLSHALEMPIGLRHDMGTMAAVRDSLAFLLETMSSIAEDGDLWHRLEDAAFERLTHEQTTRLAHLLGSNLAPLLETAGYRAPPPPPVDDLVEDTLEALVAALDVSDPDERRARVREAKRSLALFAYRTRQQLDVTAPTAELQMSRLRSLARRTTRVARWLVPKVAGVAAGVLVENVLPPGSGVLWFLVKHAAEGLASEGLAWVAASIVGRLPFDAGTGDAKDEGASDLRLDPVRSNLVALSRTLGRAQGELDALLDWHHAVRGHDDDSLDGLISLRDSLVRAGRYRQRVEDVIADLGRNEQDVARDLHALSCSLTEAVWMATRGDGVDFGHALHLIAQNLEEAGDIAERLHASAHRAESYGA